MIRHGENRAFFTAAISTLGKYSADHRGRPSPRDIDDNVDISRYHDTWGPDWWNDFWGTGDRYHDTEEHFASQNGSWYTFAPKKPRNCLEPKEKPDQPCDESDSNQKPPTGPVKLALVQNKETNNQLRRL